MYTPYMGGNGYPAGEHPMFKDYAKFIADLQAAINDEASTIDFYTRLMAMAPCEDAKMNIRAARDDEQKHLHMLCNLYVTLTGQQPNIEKTPVKCISFCDGIKLALQNELAAADGYRNMYLATYYLRIRDIFFEIMTDEMEHATRFVFVYTLVDCEQPNCEIDKTGANYKRKLFQK
jgi:rubrerythrin